MRILLALVLASLAFYGWMLVSSGAAPAVGVVLIFLALSLSPSVVRSR